MGNDINRWALEAINIPKNIITELTNSVLTNAHNPYHLSADLAKKSAEVLVQGVDRFHSKDPVYEYYKNNKENIHIATMNRESYGMNPVQSFAHTTSSSFLYKLKNNPVETLKAASTALMTSLIVTAGAYNIPEVSNHLGLNENPNPMCLAEAVKSTFDDKKIHNFILEGAVGSFMSIGPNVYKNCVPNPNNFALSLSDSIGLSTSVLSDPYSGFVAVNEYINKTYATVSEKFNYTPSAEYAGSMDIHQRLMTIDQVSTLDNVYQFNLPIENNQDKPFNPFNESKLSAILPHQKEPEEENRYEYGRSYS